MDASGRGPNLDFVRPCSTPGKFCQLLFLRGPAFFRTNISLSKRTRVTEQVDIEYRAEFLNAFNNTSFYFGGGPETTVNTMGNYSRTFGQITNAYRDIRTTDDPGARIIQMVLRINF